MDCINKTCEKINKVTCSIFAFIIFFMPVFSDYHIKVKLPQEWYTIFEPTVLSKSLSYRCYIIVGITLITSIILLTTSIIQKKFKLKLFDFFVIGHVLCIILSVINSKHTILHTVFGLASRGEGAILLLCYSLIFIIFSKGYKYVKWIFKYAIIAAICLCLRSIIIDIMINGEALTKGTMGNLNFLSSYICLFLPMMAFHYINTGKIISILSVIILFLTQIFTCTLGGYITFIIMYIICIVYSIIVNDKKRKIIINVCILTILLLSTAVVVNNIKDGKYTKQLFSFVKEVNKVTNKDNGIANNVEDNKSFEDLGTGRVGIWVRTLKVMKNNNKWFGTGPGTLLLEVEQNSPKVIDKAHSEPLHIASNIGIPAAIIYVGLVATICIWLFKECIHDIKKEGSLIEKDVTREHMILISIISYFAQSLINISVVAVAPIYWAMLGLGAGVIYSKQIKE